MKPLLFFNSKVPNILGFWLKSTLKAPRRGLVLYPFIFLSFRNPFIGTPSADDYYGRIIIKHEFIHIHQMKSLKCPWFYYAIYWWKMVSGFFKYGSLLKSYKNNSFEVEAYGGQDKPLTEEEQVWVTSDKP